MACCESATAVRALAPSFGVLLFRNCGTAVLELSDLAAHMRVWNTPGIQSPQHCGILFTRCNPTTAVLAADHVGTTSHGHISSSKSSPISATSCGRVSSASSGIDTLSMLLKKHVKGGEQKRACFAYNALPAILGAIRRFAPALKPQTLETWAVEKGLAFVS